MAMGHARSNAPSVDLPTLGTGDIRQVEINHGVANMPCRAETSKVRNQVPRKSKAVLDQQCWLETFQWRLSCGECLLAM